MSSLTPDEFFAGQVNGLVGASDSRGVYVNLAVWPSAPAPDEIVRVGSTNAAYWHREAGGRR